MVNKTTTYPIYYKRGLLNKEIIGTITEKEETIKIDEYRTRHRITIIGLTLEPLSLDALLSNMKKEI